MEKQNRLKSWATWVSALGFLWTLASTFGIPQKYGVEEGTFKTVVDCIGGLLILFGILNNPTDKNNF